MELVGTRTKTSTRRRGLAGLVAAVLGLTACSLGDSPGSQPSPGADQMAASLASALEEGTIDGLPLAGDASRAELDYQQATGAMDGLVPEVSVGAITYDSAGTTATVELGQTYSFDQGDWEFTSSATLTWTDNQWLVDWNPTVVHPQLTSTTRLYYERTQADRGSITGAGGVAIVEDRTVYKVGIDKTRVDQAQQDASARALAALVGVDAEAFAQQVAASGPQAFVLAITLRQGQVPSQIGDVAGASALETTLPLAPWSNFADGLMGTAGEATAEAIEAGDGKVVEGDIVGLSGLQAEHDEQLRGSPGHTISIIPRSESQLASLPPATPDASSSSSGTATPGAGSSSTQPSASSSGSSGSGDEQLLFSLAAVDGTDLETTIDLELQRKAEGVLAAYTSELVMAVVLDRQTGAILAAANSPVEESQNFALTGAYPPGSTMKIVTSLALIRRGMTPDSLVNCTETAEINGRVFHNYNGYPSAYNGMIPLRTAVQKSCNTAFMNASLDLSPDELRDAAASLGIGMDLDAGFDAFYGTVPTLDDSVVRAASAIGQGDVLVSPMALAAEAASAASGHTVVPYLLTQQVPTSTGQALTESEAAALRDLMGAVVQSGGTLSQMAGVLDGAKSGTAEYTNDDPPKTHSWVVGYDDRYAVSVMQYTNNGGSIPQDVVTALLS